MRKAQGFLPQIQDVQNMPAKICFKRADTWCDKVELVIQ